MFWMVIIQIKDAGYAVHTYTFPKFGGLGKSAFYLYLNRNFIRKSGTVYTKLRVEFVRVLNSLFRLKQTNYAGFTTPHLTAPLADMLFLGLLYG